MHTFINTQDWNEIYDRLELSDEPPTQERENEMSEVLETVHRQFYATSVWQVVTDTQDYYVIDFYEVLEAWSFSMHKDSDLKLECIGTVYASRWSQVIDLFNELNQQAKITHMV